MSNKEVEVVNPITINKEISNGVDEYWIIVYGQCVATLSEDQLCQVYNTIDDILTV